MVEIQTNTAVAIQPDKAYLLFRIPKRKGVSTFEPILLRIPTQEELQRYDADRRIAFAKALPKLIADQKNRVSNKKDLTAHNEDKLDKTQQAPTIDTFAFTWNKVSNLENIETKGALVKGQTENIFLVEVKQGDYVFYGASWAAGVRGVHVCFCLGTVGFTAKLNTVTDLGYIIIDAVNRPSPFPELIAETGYGPNNLGLLTGTIRPVRTDSTRPVVLDGVTIMPARYQAIGKFLAPDAGNVNRLAPIPGILDYSRGNVIDVQSGTTVPSHF